MKRLVHRMSWDARRIVSSCNIDVRNYTNKEGKEVEATCPKVLWDTGATVTVISELLVDRLGLIPIDFMRVSGFDGKPKLRNVYKVDIILNENIRFNRVSVIDAPLITSDVLIGMDVISNGDFHITHEDTSTILTFEVQ